jgi:hypothetical protein
MTRIREILPSKIKTSKIRLPMSFTKGCYPIHVIEKINKNRDFDANTRFEVKSVLIFVYVPATGHEEVEWGPLQM